MKEEQFNKFIKVPALFNNSNLLQFSFGPDKRCLNLKDTYLSFKVDLPEKFIPDNNFGAKVCQYILYDYFKAYNILSCLNIWTLM